MSWPALFGAAAGFAVAAMASAADPAPRPDFNREIRPILSNKCFLCHGPDETKREGELRLDQADDLGTDRGGYRVVVPGQADQSELIRRITSNDPGERMPPPDSGKSLSDKEIGLLRAWIDGGAAWGRHWSFDPAVRMPAPETANRAWPRTSIDGFILARQEREGLAPSSEADRVTLLRRLCLDLIGLAPTTAEVDTFLADGRPGAYERQVDRLLASPHFGERWGRRWLDAARYADSDGYEKDKSRQVWFYRDWVAGAFNDDLPYDEFVIRQIAGDLLPWAGQAEKVATGFLRNSMINEEGGVDPEQFRMEAMFDRMDAIGKGILGLTIQCAQCHNHKYDPLTQEDYYRMFACLNDCHEANLTVYTPEEEMKRGELFRRMAEEEARLKETTPDWRDRMGQWEASVAQPPVEWQVVRPEVDDISTGGQKLLALDDGSFLAQGYAPTKHKVKLTAVLPAGTITGVRLELLTDPNLPRGGPGRSLLGTAALTEFELEAAPADSPETMQPVKIARALADHNPAEAELDAIYHDKTDKRRVTGPISFAIDGKDETAWGTDAGPGRRNQPRTALFVPKQPVAYPNGTVLVLYLKQNHGGWNSDDNQNHNLGRFRLSITSAPDPVLDPLPPGLRALVTTPIEERTASQEDALFTFWRTTVDEFRETNDRIEEIWEQHPNGTTQLVLEDREAPRTTYFLERGNFLKRGPAMAPGTPAFLSPMEAAGDPPRLAFARWLVGPQSPTTARAFVNRVWQELFGTGLAATSEDLGTQGEPPTHPELLDSLAAEWMDEGWHVKRLLRTIVTSATYRQSSRITPELAARDPFNRFVARGPRFRVEAEVIRDLALSAGGLLNGQIGGPSVFPPAPEFLFVPPASYGPKVWIESQGADRYRRAMYTFRYRSVPYPMLQNFDAPNGDASCVRRVRSNTPLQALVGLNEPLFLECARGLAACVVREGGATDADRIVYAFRRVLSRRPASEEQAVIGDLLRRSRERFGAGGLDPWALAANDPAHPPALPEGTSPADLAAWTAVSRSLLNLDEAITKE
jgi:hypothetical protein